MPIKALSDQGSEIFRQRRIKAHLPTVIGVLKDKLARVQSEALSRITLGTVADITQEDRKSVV